MLLKPRTQVFLESGIKGFIADDKATLASELERFRSLVAFNRVLTDRHPDIAEPMVQEYLTAAETSIFSVSGFVAEDGAIVARAAMKVLQRPRKVGIGLCFEGRDDRAVARRRRSKRSARGSATTARSSRSSSSTAIGACSSTSTRASTARWASTSREGCRYR